MRKLASIQKVLSVDVHPNAERLSVIRVLGWSLVSGKDEFKAGDLCCYVECDSILPDRPEFEFLRSKSFRIKTVRLRGAISQGIAFNIDQHRYATTLPVVVEQQLGLNLCPLLGNVALDHSVDQMVQIASVNSTLNPARLAEGVVFRPLTEQRDLLLGRLSFKVINLNYLIERGE